MSDEDRFLKRWSRRKTAQQNQPTSEPLHEAQAVTTADAPPDEAEAIAPEDLPDIDSLDEASDFSVFMRDGVPEELKTLALRRLWRLDPMFNEVDGLVEYGEDFTKISLAAVKSIYKVGKGMLAEDEAEKPEEEVSVAEEDGGEAEKAVGLAPSTPSTPHETDGLEEPENS